MCGQGVQQASAILAPGEDSNGEHEGYIGGVGDGCVRHRLTQLIRLVLQDLP